MTESTDSAGITSFPTPADRAVQQRATRLAEILDRVKRWGEIDGSPGVGGRQWREWRDECRLILRSSLRPPTLGVFGESQSGKSFLISKFSGQGGGQEIFIQDPRGAQSNEQPAGTAQLSFLQEINAENKAESTAITCRFTRHPNDRPLQHGCFVGRVMSHRNLLASLATGFLAEMNRDEMDSDAYVECITGLFDRARAASSRERGPRLDDVEHSWRVLERRHQSSPHVKRLRDAGFGDLVSGEKAREPDGEGWNALVGLLWCGGRDTFLDRLYRELLGLLERMGHPDLLDVPAETVCRSERQTPITDVLLLNKLFDDQEERVPVHCRKDGATANSDHLLTRPQISALLSELVLPVAATHEPGLLDVADVLDFPGARRSTGMHKIFETDENQALGDALSAFRRGKLLRLFGSLTEEREITNLGLVVRADGNLEAQPEVRGLLEPWLTKQREYLAHEGSESAIGLFLAITAVDKFVNIEGAADYGRCRFNNRLRETRDAYSSSGQEGWMDRWADGQPFQDVHWVHDPDRFPIRKGESHGEHLNRLRQLYVDSPLVSRYVSDPQAKWDDMLATGGLRLLLDRVVARVQSAPKHRRLRHELDELRDRMLTRLKRDHVESGEFERQAAARREAQRDVAELKSLATGRRPHIVPRLLSRMRLDRSRVASVLAELEHLHGSTDQHGVEIRVTTNGFLDQLRGVWERLLNDELGTDRVLDEIGLSAEVAQSIANNWTQLCNAPWMTDRIRTAIDGYFQSPHGAHRHRRGLVAAACWAWNRSVIELGQEPESVEEPSLPPELTGIEEPVGSWVLQHWERRMPEVYAANVSDIGPPPAGNDELGAILQELRVLEAET